MSTCLAGGLTPYIPTYSTFSITSKAPRYQYIKHFIRFVNKIWHYRRIKQLLVTEDGIDKYIAWPIKSPMDVNIEESSNAFPFWDREIWIMLEPGMNHELGYI